MSFLVEAVFSLVIWIIVFPVARLISTPVILISAFFAADPYWISVKKKYSAVTNWCGKYGWAMSP